MISISTPGWARCPTPAGRPGRCRAPCPPAGAPHSPSWGASAAAPLAATAGSSPAHTHMLILLVQWLHQDDVSGRSMGMVGIMNVSAQANISLTERFVDPWVNVGLPTRMEWPLASPLELDPLHNTAYGSQPESCNQRPNQELPHQARTCSHLWKLNAL